jgi:hypothetical protein
MKLYYDKLGYSEFPGCKAVRKPTVRKPRQLIVGHPEVSF